ncbi:23718_t:CDS:2 [Entrophospora sp. SA101]|nr:8792_t:CDS:2 [Entrophospora sp. SA101]CAJ0629847.1 4208_t:CDS:2 [Entrophospora sp. SA101]CAJ0757183.1 698_t:CDS:2 [Entrophospora sp. SA101]CAJ0768278.1 23718_t:CDS:2 [Entrophospora sp. SA101]CAJ0828060.1 303_t:CDS:2 [Entrophospora sp. SA101]
MALPLPSPAILVNNDNSNDQIITETTIAQSSAVNGSTLMNSSSTSTLSLRIYSSTPQPVNSTSTSAQPIPPSSDKVTAVFDFTSTDPLSLENSRKSEEEIRKNKKKKIQKFYRDQNELIDELLSPIEQKSSAKSLKKHNLKLKIAIYGSMFVNVCLCALQLYAAISTKSLALFATMVDSCMDLLSNGILLFTGRAANRKNLLVYPTGKAKMETAGIIVFSSLMIALSIEISIEAIKALINHDNPPEVSEIAIICIGCALDNASSQALAQDHRNDLVINSFGLTMSLLSSRIEWWIDPAGAITISLFILKSWTTTAYGKKEQKYESIKKYYNIITIHLPSSLLTHPDVSLSALTHHEKILQVDTCRAYHSGYKLFVEIDIVMDRDTPLWESHDVGEGLQNKLEKLANVDRAFVHVDYESSHKPEHQKEE